MIILENTKFQSERGLETLKILNYKIDLSAFSTLKQPYSYKN